MLSIGYIDVLFTFMVIHTNIHKKHLKTKLLLSFIFKITFKRLKTGKTNQIKVVVNSS